MADQADDLEYSEDNMGSTQAQGVRKNISLKLKGKSRGRGRRAVKGRRNSTKKSTEVAEDEECEETTDAPSENAPVDKQFDPEVTEVISKLETPAFSPMDRTFSEPLHQNKKLRWDHKVSLIGEKVINPMIHCCEKCSLPILNYGRMIPCKHVFCYDCAKKADKHCPKCEDKVQRVEQSALGTVFMCTFGGTRHVPGACGRTYLSQRDLQAHVNHRHLKPASTSSASNMTASTIPTTPVPATIATTSHAPVTRDPRDPRAHLQVEVAHPPPLLVGHLPPPEHRDPVEHARNPPSSTPPVQTRQYQHSPASYSNTIPVSSARPNLITVPIQDDGGAPMSTVPAPQHIHPQPHSAQYAAAAATTPMPMAHAPANYQPHAYQSHPLPAQAPAYSQAGPMSTQTFSQPPPPVLHQPPIHAQSGPVYSTPPPQVHHPPPPTYTPPRGPRSLPPPQRFPPSSGSYEENPSYMPQWRPGGVPPPPARAPLPHPAPPNSNVGLLQPHGPTEPPYRPPYYP